MKENIITAVKGTLAVVITAGSAIQSYLQTIEAGLRVLSLLFAIGVSIVTIISIRKGVQPKPKKDKHHERGS